jgi:hypothetical protein
MAAAAHNPKFRKKVGVPKDVAEDFNAADTGTGILKKKKKGGGQLSRPNGGQFNLKKEGKRF